MPHPCKLFTVRQAAEMLAVTPKYLYSEIQEGRLRCFRLSERNTRIMEVELIRFIQARLEEEKANEYQGMRTLPVQDLLEYLASWANRPANRKMA